MYTRRKITTYKGRNRRKRDQDDDPNHIPTSPLSEIDKEETTLPEMSRRMGKRSRLLAASSVPDLSAIADTSKDSASVNSSKRPRVRGDIAHATSGPLSTIFNAEFHANSFQTPVTSALPFGKNTSSGFLNHRPASSLSPVPFTKPVFTFGTKENLVASRLQNNLASPFNSHPNSRNGSPAKSKSKLTKRPRAKSRTLSAHLSENRDFTAPATDVAPSPDRKKAKTLHHGRNPSLPSFAVDDSPDWLKYAEVRPRKPLRGSGRRNIRGSSRFAFNATNSGSQPGRQLLPICSSPFSLELPLAFSTPPTNRRFNHSPQGSVDWGGINLTQKFLDTDIEDEGADADVEMADAETFIPDSASRIPRITNTRRQTVHVSRDSLFSSMEISNSGSVSAIAGIPIDVSGYGTTADRTVGNELPSRSASNSVMSLTGVLEPTDTNKLPILGQAFEQSHDDAGGSDWMTDNEMVPNALIENRPKLKSSRKKSSATCIDDLEALGAKVSEMNLEGLVRSRQVILGRWADTAVAPFNRSHSMPTVIGSNQALQVEKPVVGSNKNAAGRDSRKRSDTIRASDYNVDRLPQPKVVWLKPAPAPKRKAPTRKRSGTVTQRDFQASVRVCKDGRITKIDDGLPLSPQKDNESDDDLLLK